MKVVNLSEARRHLSKLVDKAAKGEPFLIARNGKPLVKVMAIEETPQAKAMQRIGFLEGHFKIPDDFDTMGQAEIEEMFYGKLD